MFVCICKAVTDSQLQERVATGADSVRTLSRCTGLGTECGKCVCFARERIDHHKDALQEQAQELAQEVA